MDVLESKNFVNYRAVAEGAFGVGVITLCVGAVLSVLFVKDIFEFVRDIRS